MKHIFIVLAVFTTLSLSAQRQHRTDSQKRSHDIMKSMSAEQLATLQTKKMTLDLNLNEAQQKEMHMLQLEKHQEKLKKRQERLEKKKEQHTKDLNSDAFYSKMITELDRKIVYKHNIRSILSEDQFNTWEKRTPMKRKRNRFRHKTQRH